MKTFKINISLISAIFLNLIMLPRLVNANPDTPEIKRMPIVSCILNKSYTLEIYKELLGDGSQSFVIENKSFIEALGNGQKILTLNLNRSYQVEYGDVLMYTFNLGRSGYFFMRIDKKIKPSNTDLGNATLHYDNNLFEQTNKPFFTNGRMVLQSNCNYLGSIK